MQANKRKRIGCDLCKKDKATFGFTHPFNLDIWLCEGCYEVLTGIPAFSKPNAGSIPACMPQGG